MEINKTKRNVTSKKLGYNWTKQSVNRAGNQFESTVQFHVLAVESITISRGHLPVS